MKIDVLTLFPAMFDGVLSSSIIGKALDRGIASIQMVDYRQFADNKHYTVDDTPYGGGGGMVLKPEPIFNAVEHLIEQNDKQTAGEPVRNRPHVILMCPQGEKFTQRKAAELARKDHIILICGHYEGYDERIRQHLVDEELSIGDYVLTGGEIPAMAVIDSVVRLLPGTLGNELSASADSFSTGLLEHPHYTKPPVYREWEVPEVLLSGHHERIASWRRKESLRRTWQRRPELLETLSLSDIERIWLKEFATEETEQRTDERTEESNE